MMADTHMMLMAPILLVTGVVAAMMISQAFAGRREAQLRPVKVRTRRVTRR